MSTFVLVHGAWHGAWCWAKITPLLAQAGHKVIAIDLPGHGDDKTPTAAVTLAAYVDRVCQVLDAQTEPVILVGHSMGGVVITQTAEARPAKIKKLVYLTAFLLRDGEFLLQLAGGDTTSLVLPNLVMSADQSSATVKDEGIQPAFYADCLAEDVAFAKARLVAQAAQPFATPVHTTAQNFGRVPRAYIECLQDRAIAATLQKQMYTALPCERVITMNTSHSPFFAAPQELAKHLLDLA